MKTKISQEDLIKEENNNWKKYSPILYELIISQALEWPSLTVEWLPLSESKEKSNCIVQNLLLGTHTSFNIQNHLLIMKVRLPIQYQNKDTIDPIKDTKIEILIKINHNGEVNKARHMPQHSNIIATKTISGEIHLFDYFKHPTKPSDNITKPNLILQGHKKEGFGLSWSSIKDGYLISGSDDYKTCLWDVNTGSGNPLTIFEDHNGSVEDVGWSSKEDNIFGSVGDDKRMIIYDIRINKPILNILAHSLEINSLDFNPSNSKLVLTASNDKLVNMWDLRKPTQKIHSFVQHKDDVISARWNPIDNNLFASSGGDRRILVWDTKKIQPNESITEKIPSELIFIHGGHTSKVSDICWNPKEKFMIGSVAEDNIIQVWEMSEMN